jgi:hypothetical protein
VSQPNRLSIREPDHFRERIVEYFPREERGPLGQLSRRDFIALELEPAKEIFATDFYELDELIPGRTDYRVRSFTGRFVPLFTIYAQVTPDGATVELIELEVDLDPTSTFWEDPD